MGHVTSPHEDTLVFTTDIDGYYVNGELIDSGSSIVDLFLDALKKMGKGVKDLKKVNFPLMAFASKATYLVGSITLPVYLSEGWKSLTANVTFIVVDAPTSYNAILGAFNSESPQNGSLHLPLIGEISNATWNRVVKGDQPAERNYYVHSV